MELLHAKNYIHRDIKPENFLMGVGKNSHILHCIDFGLSKKYRDLKTHQHIPYKQNRSLTGTARYSSVNAHLGIQQSRRDDLQSIGYVLIYFLHGSLPWQGIRVPLFLSRQTTNCKNTRKSCKKKCPYLSRFFAKDFLLSSQLI